MTYAANADAAFRFLRPRKPRKPSPVASNGSVAGSGVVAVWLGTGIVAESWAGRPLFSPYTNSNDWFPVGPLYVPVELSAVVG